MLQAEGYDPNVSRFCSKNSEIGIYRISDTVAVKPVYRTVKKNVNVKYV